MDSLYEKVQESAGYIKSRIQTGADHAIILGTGLGDFSASINEQISLSYDEIPNFPASTVKSHDGYMIFGYKSGIPIIALSGRFHYYEGYTSKELTFPIRVLKALGIKHLILTNAAGGVNPHFKEGDIILIKDHINMMPDHPLRGQNDERLGIRFPDMLSAYDQSLNDNFLNLATELKMNLRTGVYLGLQGPSLETPAEYRMANILGADLVGMSTIPEVIVARHCMLQVSAFSIVSNICFPSSVLTETTLDEVIAVVNDASKNLTKLLDKFFAKM